MADGLAPLPPEFLNPDLPFHGAAIAPSLRLSDYWRWSASCLLDNTARGILAEFLVTTALNGLVEQRPRVEWDAYDILAEIQGREVSVEVKSSSRVQSWQQHEHSSPRFGIAPTSKWDADTGEYSDRPLRADIYVFCLFTATNVEAHAAAVNVDDWRFRVVPGSELPGQKTIGWNRLGAFRTCGYSHLAQEVESVAARIPGIGCSPGDHVGGARSQES